MMHMHGVRAQELTQRSVGVALDRLVAVPVDVGKSTAMAMVVDFCGQRLAAPFEFTLDRPGVAGFVAGVEQALPAEVALVRVGVEACGHYHRPLVAAEFADPARLAALGVARFRAFAARRDVRVSAALAQRLVAAARDALPTPDAAVARQVLAADLALLERLDTQLAEVNARITALVPATVYGVLVSGPGWGPVRAAGYAAGVGDPARWPSHRQIYHAAGLNPAQYESARATPRRRHQPRRVGAVAPGDRRPRDGPVAPRPRRPRLHHRDARARQSLSSALCEKGLVAL